MKHLTGKDLRRALVRMDNALYACGAVNGWQRIDVDRDNRTDALEAIGRFIKALEGSK